MVIMTATELDALPRGRALTAYEVAELDEPEPGSRLELIDGVLIVMESPALQHQRVQANLLKLLFAAEPADLWVLASPFDILAVDSAVQPDIGVVLRQEARGSRHLEQAPRLAVEILSPSTRLRDLTTKFTLYERMGVPSYWVVDPIDLEMVVWELRDGAYAEVARLHADDTWTAEQPFGVTITPGRLLD